MFSPDGGLGAVAATFKAVGPDRHKHTVSDAQHASPLPPKNATYRATGANHVPSGSTEGEGLTRLMFLPEAHALVAPSPQVDQLEAVVTATAEQLAVVGADVQRGDFPPSRKFLNAAEGPA